MWVVVVVFFKSLLFINFTQSKQQTKTKQNEGINTFHNNDV